MPAVKTKVWALPSGRLAKNTAHAGVWNVARIGLQALSLVLLARLFGVAGYGTLAGTVALFTAIAQLTGFGTGLALLRHVAREGEVHEKLPATQVAFLVTGVLLVMLAWPLAVALFPGIAPATLAMLASAEIVLAPALLPLVYAHQAEERLFVSGFLLTVAPLARLSAILLAFGFDVRSIDAFALLYVLTLGMAVGVVLLSLWPRHHAKHGDLALGDAMREGAPFMVAAVAMTAGAELDKTVVLRAIGNVAAGQYAAAYRVVQAATLPVNSLVLAATPRLFRDARTRGSFRLLLAAFAYATVAAIGLWVVAPLLPWLLGPAFAPAIPILRAMCLLLVSGSARQVLMAQLTASDLQTARNVIEGAAAGFAVVALLVVVPRYGVFSAVWTLVSVDIVACITTWCILRRTHARHGA